MAQITKNAAYDAVAPHDFAAMLEPERYGRRASDFDRFIAASQDHFWNPLDKRTIDFSTPFDLARVQMLPDGLFPFFLTGLGQSLTPGQKVIYVNEATRWSVSSVLHGEQGALALSASLCHVLKDPGAQEYAASQTREEARHVTAFSAYIKARWGTPLPAGPTLANMLAEMVEAPEVYKKIVGMQMLVEGLAMGAFATFYQKCADPLLVRLCQLVMTDEAFHHKFGKMWADRTIPKLTVQEHMLVEDWAVQCFQTLLFNLINPEQMKSVYATIGVDWEEAQAQTIEAFTDDERREQMKHGANIFRVLTKTLLNAGIITSRTRAFYAMYVDLDELAAEGERMIGDDIAEEGMRYLRSVNAARPRRRAG